MKNTFKKLAVAGVMVLGISQAASADDHNWDRHDNGKHKGWDKHDRWDRDHRRNVIVRREYYSAPVRYYEPGPYYYDPYYTYVAPAPVYVAPRPVYYTPAPSTSINVRF